jgi:hypothetical protein
MIFYTLYYRTGFNEAGFFISQIRNKICVLFVLKFSNCRIVNGLINYSLFQHY